MVWIKKFPSFRLVAKPRLKKSESFWIRINSYHDVIANAMDFDILVGDFKLQSYLCVQFQTGKGRKPFILSDVG